jgi:hypothetical protein
MECLLSFPRILRRGPGVGLRPASGGTTRALPLTRALCRGGAAKAKLNTAPTAGNAEENKKKAAAAAQKRADAREYMKRANSKQDGLGVGSADSPGGYHHHHHHHQRRGSMHGGTGDISAQFATLRPEDCEFPGPRLPSQSTPSSSPPRLSTEATRTPTQERPMLKRGHKKARQNKRTRSPQSRLSSVSSLPLSPRPHLFFSIQSGIALCRGGND